jgi:predicted nucleotidyltransferase
MIPQRKSEIKLKLSTMADLFNSYQISRVGLFGSYVHDSQNEESDIDLLVEMKKPVDLFSYANLADTLSREMQQKVDVVMVTGLKPALRSKILDEVEWIEGI